MLSKLESYSYIGLWEVVGFVVNKIIHFLEKKRKKENTLIMTLLVK